ncbi:MAG: V-type ATP synthase subunit D [Candidatus Latescibacterota bacterium]
MEPDKIAPTKGNLIDYRSKRAFAQEGYELLDQKREVLIMELMRVVYSLKDLQERLNTRLHGVYETFEEVHLQMGTEAIERVLTFSQTEYEVEVTERSVMGVLLPTIRDQMRPEPPNPSLMETTEAVDRCAAELGEVLSILSEYAETTISVGRLAHEIRKTQRRVKALEHLFIPRYDATIKKIEDVLEESEREEFFRRKRLKKS